MLHFPHFNITDSGPVSAEFLRRGMETFEQSAMYIKRLPYGRNATKENLLSVFDDGHGTCSTKHALLKQLADENKFTELRLVLGIFRMSAENTPVVAGVLQQYGLPYIPEAHNYLRFQEYIVDCTTSRSAPQDFMYDLLEETQIQPSQITGYKVAYHKNYLARWLKEEPEIPYSAEAIWPIREACIAAMAQV